MTCTLRGESRCTVRVMSRSHTTTAFSHRTDCYHVASDRKTEPSTTPCWTRGSVPTTTANSFHRLLASHRLLSRRERSQDRAIYNPLLDERKPPHKYTVVEDEPRRITTCQHPDSRSEPIGSLAFFDREQHGPNAAVHNTHCHLLPPGFPRHNCNLRTDSDHKQNEVRKDLQTTATTITTQTQREHISATTITTQNNGSLQNASKDRGCWCRPLLLLLLTAVAGLLQPR